MSDVTILDQVPSSTPHVAELLTRDGRTVDGAANDFIRLVATGRARSRHLVQLLQYIDVSLDSQLAGYGAGMARFPKAPHAQMFAEFATFKLKARALLRGAAAAVQREDPSAIATPPPVQALHYGWCFLWLGAVPPLAATGLGMYAGLLIWHRFCVALPRSLSDGGYTVPDEFTKVFTRFEQRPSALDSCLVAAEYGLAQGDSETTAIEAIDMTLLVTDEILRVSAE